MKLSALVVSVWNAAFVGTMVTRVVPVLSNAEKPETAVADSLIRPPVSREFNKAGRAIPCSLVVDAFRKSKTPDRKSVE